MSPSTNSPKRSSAKQRARKLHKNRLVHLPKQEDLYAFALDAPIGTYAIDEIVEEFLLIRIFRKNPSLIEELRNTGIIPNEPSIIHATRHRIRLAGVSSIVTANGEYVRRPKHQNLTNRFLEDLDSISHLIERNRGLDPLSVLLIAGKRTDATKQLKQMLEAMRWKIDEYRGSHGMPRTNPRNRDPLSTSFIMEIFEEVWCPLRYGEYAPDFRSARVIADDDRRRFVRVLAAAWKDLRFPGVDDREYSYESLENWFLDRLRKDSQFSGFWGDHFMCLPEESRFRLLECAIADEKTSPQERSKLMNLREELLRDCPDYPVGI